MTERGDLAYQGLGKYDCASKAKIRKLSRKGYVFLTYTNTQIHKI